MTFLALIREILHTINAIENLNGSVRRAVKTVVSARHTGIFIRECAIGKLIYLPLRDAIRTRMGPLKDWSAAQREFAICFGERFEASPDSLQSR